jgi:hypothetical protein
MKTRYLLTCSFIFLFGSSLLAQRPVSERRQMHYETESDPWIPNEWNNQKLSPPYRFGNPEKQSGTGSTIFTTQVNVSPGGLNIVGDAANEPSIAVNPVNPAQMVIGWRQFDNVTSNFRQAGWAYTSDSGQTWIFPGKIEPGVFRSDPVLDVDAAGNFYYNSLTNTPDYFCKVFKSTNGGLVWDTGTDAQGGDKQWMAIDRSGGPGMGNIYSAWTSVFSTCQPGHFTRSANAGVSYENCTVVDGDPFWMTMEVNNSGDLIIAGWGGISDSLLIVVSPNAQNAGSTIAWPIIRSVYMDGVVNGWVPVNPSGLLGQVNVGVDRSNGPGQDNIYVVASLSRLSSTDMGDVMFTRSTDGGLTWSAPVKINDDVSTDNTQWFGTMSVAPNGRIDVVWLDTRDAFTGTNDSGLWYSYSNDQGMTWSPNEKLSPDFDPHVGYPNQQKLGDYFDMVSDSLGAHLAWANTLLGEQNVYYSYIQPPVTTGIEHVKNAPLSVYPNPSAGQLNIKGDLDQGKIEIYDMPGRLIFEKETQGYKAVFNLEELPASAYLVRFIHRDGSSQVSRWVKY